MNKTNNIFLKKSDQIVFDFITQEEINIDDFLLEDSDNHILIHLDNKTIPICFNRQYLETIRETNEFLECKYKNNQLMPIETKKGSNFFRIGYYLYHVFINILINEKSVNLLKNKKHKIFHLNIKNPAEEEGKIMAINKEFLKLAVIGLEKKPKPGILKTNSDYYFEQVFNMALRDYSYRWDSPINSYLRFGDTYFNHEMFQKLWKRYYSYVPEYLSNIYEYHIKSFNKDTKNKFLVYPANINESIQNVKERIKQLDTCFIEVAPRIEKPISYWRGMKGNFPITDIGDTYIIPNFLSTSINKMIALKFVSENSQSSCCLYEFIPDSGIPFIDMTNTSIYKHEKEILFPRNLKLTYLSTYEKGGKSIKRVRLSISNENQFVIPTGCNNMSIGTIEPMKIVLQNEQNIINSKTKSPQMISAKSNNNNNKYKKENAECNKKNKEYNPNTKKCVNKCNQGKVRNENFRCVANKTTTTTNKTNKTTSKKTTKTKLNKTICNKKNKDYNPNTKKCVNKCATGKVRNENFRCVNSKPPAAAAAAPAAAPLAPAPAAAPLALAPAAAPLALAPAAAPLALAPAPLAPAPLVVNTKGLTNLIIKDKSQCSNMIKSMGKEIAKGGYGAIFQLSNGMLVKKSYGLKPQALDGLSPEEDLNNCVTGKGCKNDIILEGLIMHALSTLNSEHFVRIEEFYHCENNYYIVMESLNGESYSNFIKKNAIDMQTRLTILFQITYALHLANSKLSFVHGDLIGQNIMITKVPRKIIEYKVTTFYNTTVYKIDNLGIRVVLIDFGFSRIIIDNPNEKNANGIELYQTFRNPEYFPTKLDLFNGAADICKVYSNPTIVKGIDMSKATINNGIRKLITMIQNCKSVHWSHIAVPPFPQMFADDILRSGLFNSIYL
jgi:hypothetical protein